MSLHKAHITKGVYGELSKIREELEEAVDAENQKQDLMLLLELADIVGACAGVAEKYHFSLDQLVAFAKLRSNSTKEENKSNSTGMFCSEESRRALADSVREMQARPLKNG